MSTRRTRWQSISTGQKMKGDVVKFCRFCHTCQVAGKPNQKKIQEAHLKPITAFEEPFRKKSL